MHAIVELQDNAEQCVRATKVLEDREQPRPTHKVKSFGQIYKRHVQRTLLFDVFILKLSSREHHVNG